MKEVPLGEVSDFIRGITFRPEDIVSLTTPDAVICMRTKNIQRSLDTSDVLAVPSRLVKRPAQMLTPGDILVSSANSSNLVGKCCWVPKQKRASTFGGFVSVLRVTSPTLDSRYLYRWFSSRKIQKTLRTLGRQTTNISNLNIDRCRDLLIPLPPLDTQRHIVDVLDSVDRLRETAQSVIALLHQLRTAMFVDMFGDPLSGDERWPVAPLSELGEIVTGNTPSRENPRSPSQAIPWVKSDNLRGPSVFVSDPAEVVSRDAAKRPRIVQDGAVLVTCIAGSPTSIGNCAIADREVAFNQQINAIVPRGSDSEFIYTQLQLVKRRIQAQSTGGMKGIISKSRLSNLPVMLPPLELQQEYGKRFRQVNCISEKAEARLSQFDELFASLQSRAFKGQL